MQRGVKDGDDPANPVVTNGSTTCLQRGDEQGDQEGGETVSHHDRLDVRPNQTPGLSHLQSIGQEIAKSRFGRENQEPIGRRAFPAGEHPAGEGMVIDRADQRGEQGRPVAYEVGAYGFARVLHQTLGIGIECS